MYSQSELGTSDRWEQHVIIHAWPNYITRNSFLNVHLQNEHI